MRDGCRAATCVACQGVHVTAQQQWHSSSGTAAVMASDFAGHDHDDEVAAPGEEETEGGAPGAAQLPDLRQVATQSLHSMKQYMVIFLGDQGSPPWCTTERGNEGPP